MEPSPILSPGLSAEAQVLAASSCTPVDLPLELGGAGGQPRLTVLVFLLSACDSLAAMLCSEPLKGVSKVRETFLFHSSPSGMLVPYQSFASFFHPT